MEMTGISYNSKELILDGKSLVPMVTGDEPGEKRALYWHFPHYSNHGQQSPCGVIRYGDYKLIEYYENFNVQLFNLSDDPAEQNDLAEVEPEKADELREMLHEWRKDVDAQMMEPNPEYHARAR